ncbi:MAG: DUF2461 domain-containing protein [Ruminococcaceae bacterium]|nr:DUF2461 domain-containing protein [Oscillospiraceae bacterium]
MDAVFAGFTPETVDFLWGIRLNNNREWFMENKPNYVRHLYEPMKALGAELFQPFVDKPGELLKVSRIYRDARMHHPLPYKESLWICIRQDVDWWAENPCLFFEINPEGVDYGFFIWQPRVATLKEFHRDIAARPEPFLEMIRKTEKDTGMEISAELYKRPEKTEDPRLERFFAWKKAIGCIRHEDFSPEVLSPELAIRVADFFQKLMPVYDYFNKFKV